MSKPNIGDKYIIEIDSHMTNKKGDLYGVKGFRSLVFDQNGIEKLTPYDEESAYAEGYTNGESKFREVRDKVEQEAYQRGYDAGSHEATSLEYQCGLDDAWDALRMWCKLSNGERIKIFGMKRTKQMVECFEPSVVKRLIEEREAQEDTASDNNEIKIGDEIAHYLQDRLVVVTGIEYDRLYGVIRNGMYKGLTHSIDMTNHEWIKTGRHVDLTELFGNE